MAFARSTKDTIDHLNSFLRGELSAVESYQLALDHLSPSSPARTSLETCMQSHSARVDTITDMIRRLGGEPADGAGAWGAFTKAVEGTASALGDKAAIAALEQGEDHGLNDYVSDVNKLDADARELVVSTLLPQQEETHRTMSTLKKNLR
jgi:hypothetical protein